MAPDVLRLFIAIELPEHTRQALADAIESLRRDLRGPFRWTSPDSLHLTLKFLGNVEGARVAALRAALEQAVTGASVHRLALEGAGTFPARGSPRVLWAGVGGDADALLALQASAEHTLIAAGEAPQDHAFSPHLTLARVRDPLPGAAANELRQRLQQVRFAEDAAFQVGEVSLVQSTLTPRGAVYRTLHRVPLGK